MITLLVTLACIAGFVGVCWILFVKLWPAGDTCAGRAVLLVGKCL